MSDEIRPKRFINTHTHTTFSPADGLGYPNEFFEWCIENGMYACAITEHGSANSYAHAQLWMEDYNKKHAEQPFKYIPGIEAYYHPNLEQWKLDKQQHDDTAEDRKEAKRLQKKMTVLVPQDASDDDEVETSNQLVVENEDETKSSKRFNPVNRRHHLLVLPKNESGLQKLFAMISKSYLKSFYRFPRIDTSDLREAAGENGDLVVTSACMGGPLAYEIFRVFKDVEFDEMHQSLLDDPVLMSACLEAIEPAYSLIADAVGVENFYLELQFNKLPAQHLINRALTEFAKKKRLEHMLVVTNDAHYSRPEFWREREIYKMLGFMNYKEMSPDSLPKSRDELKYELYPKNADQLWDYYKMSTQGMSFYDDSVICAAIERAHDIAYNVLGTIKPDRTVKLPKSVIPPGKTGIQHLVDLCKEGMVKRGLNKDPVYIARLKEELEVIKFLNVPEYFVTLQKMMELSRQVVLVGPARGCFTPDTRVLMSDGLYAPIGTVKSGDIVIDAYGDKQKVSNVFCYNVDEELLELEFMNNKKIKCTKEHKFLTSNRGWVEAQHLNCDDDVIEI